MTAIYLVPYHSKPGCYRKGSTGQFEAVEEAISAGEWPYDNGDDPSFYLARRGGPLTWGVCHQEVRNSIKRGSIVVFFSFTPNGQAIRYRLSAIGTVADLLDRRHVYTDARFREYRNLYLNVLLKPITTRCWKYDEGDRPPEARHGDWLWRIAVHGKERDPFKSKYKTIYETDQFNDGDLKLAENYVLFSAATDETYISPNPPNIAVATKCQHEIWNDPELQGLTVKKAGTIHPKGRDFLRVANPTNRNVHVPLRFNLPTEEAKAWRRSLISVLRKWEDRPMSRKAIPESAPRKCPGFAYPPP